MKLKIKKSNLLRLAQETLDENFWDIRDLFSNTYEGKEISNENLLDFVIENWE